MNRQRAVFLDRDGTINIDTGYLYRIEDFRFISRAIEALRLLKSHGYKLIVVTNQSGVARGFYKESDIIRLHAYINQRLKQEGADIDHFYYCPHHPEAAVTAYRQVCSCRKPEPGLLLRAAAEHPIDMASSYCIGDKCRDVIAGKRAGCRTLLIIPEAQSLSPKAIHSQFPCRESVDSVAGSLYEAACAITNL